MNQLEYRSLSNVRTFAHCADASREVVASGELGLDQTLEPGHDGFLVHTKQVRKISRDVSRPPVMGRCVKAKHASERHLWLIIAHLVKISVPSGTSEFLIS
jgi:hypothetical protein